MQTALFNNLPPLLADRAEQDIDQARYELHRAIDFGTSADRATWCERWGEALVDRATPRSRAGHYGVDEPISTAPVIFERMPKGWAAQ